MLRPQTKMLIHTRIQAFLNNRISPSVFTKYFVWVKSWTYLMVIVVKLRWLGLLCCYWISLCGFSNCCWRKETSLATERVGSNLIYFLPGCSVWRRICCFQVLATATITKDEFVCNVVVQMRFLGTHLLFFNKNIVLLILFNGETHSTTFSNSRQCNTRRFRIIAIYFLYRTLSVFKII